MCGISGLLVRESSEAIAPILHRMNNRIRHRGPDDEGYVFFNGNDNRIVYGDDTPDSTKQSTRRYAPKNHINELGENSFHLGFGHRRLSIIDLSDGGHQPMCIGSDDEVWITCNGEIYNYIELREELQTLGYQFNSNSDMEVLLNAYLCWGVNCLARFNGMWAFVIYDKRKNILFGARDRFGVKPLYYTLNKYHFAFASEHKSILEVPSYLPEVNTNAIFPHLLYGNVEMEPESFFKNIFELMPSHYFIYDVSKSDFSINRYYSLPVSDLNPTFNQADFDKAKDRTYQLIEKAVKLRLRSDIPIGFCLSGGLDSSAIVSISNRLNQQQQISQLSGGIKAFTAGNNSEFDESNWAKIVADEANAEWVNTVVNADTLFDELENIIYHQDIPLFSTSTYAQNRVMRSAREHGISILLDGQGGDEIFAGYPPFYTGYLNQLLGDFQLSEFFKELSSLGNSPFNASIYGMSLAKITTDKCLPSKAKQLMSITFKPEFELLNKSALGDYGTQIQFSGEFKNKGVNSMLAEYCTGTYLKNLLRWEDRCSMQYSIESRTPFSDDKELIEYLFSLPANYKIHHGWSKYIMRQAIEGVVPDEIRNRKDKKGFSVPQNAWLMEKKSELKSLFVKYQHLDTFGLVNIKLIEEQWNTIFSDAKNSKKQDLVFRYVCFLIWLNLFFPKS